MSEQPNVVIILSRCKNSKQLFGIRLEEKSRSQWFADWAFSVQEKKARKEGYGQNQVRGSFQTDPAYPGCPYCHASGFFLCGCGKIGCYDGESRFVICPWCGNRIELGGTINSLSTSTDR